jgi:hypothetical protein
LETPSFTALFEYLLANADVWHRPLKNREEADPDFTPTSLSWRLVAPAPAMFSAADPFFATPPPRKRKRAELEEEEDDIPRTPEGPEDEGKCETCHRAPKAPNRRICAGCRLRFEREGVTPPGFVRNRAKVLRPACSDCGEKPARKGGAKCEACCYKGSTTACTSCGVAGVKIAKGLCPACFKKARRAAKTGGRHEEDMEETD